MRDLRWGSGAGGGAMARWIDVAARAEVAATEERYAASGRAAKGAILDEFVALTGLPRRRAVRALGTRLEERRPGGRPKTRCDTAVKDALVPLREASVRA